MTRLVMVSAGLGDPSTTALLAERIGAAAVEALGGGAGSAAGSAGSGSVVGVDVHHVTLRGHAHAIADAMLAGFPAGELAEDLERVRAADALVLVTPTFQATFSGLFKGFLDLVEPGTLRGTPVVLAATGGTERHSLVVDHALRPLAAYLGMLPTPTGVFAATADFGGEGAEALERRIARAAGELAGLVGGGPVVGVGRSGEGTASGGRTLGSGDPFDPEVVTPFEQLLGDLGQPPRDS
ncbi:FMN reductase [Kytococcus aerolatus]|uniref:FMN reductase n=1 Tax=Kytococcus aerolatus TaxID=592308 RepID=A0A212TE64_9MICO|nr:CE1759 family FMN reductase [Kytococcus aerolatus]SNC64347.1 FMN reductase [Kytococcus aerolatus]